MDETTQPIESPENPSENASVQEAANDEEVIFQPQNELPFPTEVDLNELFPDEDKNLNDLFPDEETRLLLKKMQKNKKDLHTMTDRFLEEDWSSDVMESVSEESDKADTEKEEPEK